MVGFGKMMDHFSYLSYQNFSSYLIAPLHACIYYGMPRKNMKVESIQTRIREKYRERETKRERHGN